MVCVIVGAGDFSGFFRCPAPSDYLIAADGGYRHLKGFDRKPNLVLGDFDSLGSVPSDENVVRVPVEKDDTDMMLAVKEGLARGCTKFEIYGGLGGTRTDHTLANLQTLCYLTARGAKGTLYGVGECYTALAAGEKITFPAREKGILSVFAALGAAAGVTISGAKYPLFDASLTPDFPLGVSNHFIGREVTVTVKSGMLLLAVLDSDE